MRARLFTTLALTIALSACDGDASHGETYQIAPAQVRATLLETDAPIQVLGQQAIDWKTAEQGEDTVLWTVLDDNGGQLIRFSAKMIPVDNGTRVDVAVLPPEGKLKDRVTKGLTDNPSVRNLYFVAMTEEIDAKLENRGFDASRIAMATIQAASANMTSIGASMDQAAKEFDKRDRENVSRAYREEGRATGFGHYGEDGGYGKKFGEAMDNPNIR